MIQYMKLKSNGQGFGDAQTTIERILDLTMCCSVAEIRQETHRRVNTTGCFNPPSRNLTTRTLAWDRGKLFQLSTYPGLPDTLTVKPFTVVFQPLSTRLMKPNFCFPLSHRRSTTVSLETRNPINLPYCFKTSRDGAGFICHPEPVSQQKKKCLSSFRRNCGTASVKSRQVKSSFIAI